MKTTNNKRIYCDEMPRPEGFEDMILYNGFNAFFARRTPEQRLNRLIKFPGREICVSTQHLGTIGAAVKGDVLMACNIDMFSGIDMETRRRYYNNSTEISENIVSHANQLIEYTAEDQENNEIIIKNVKIQYLWVTSDAGEKIKQEAKRLADVYGFELRILEPSILYE